jgi:hypothetical protein
MNHNDSADKNNVEAKISYSDLFGPKKTWGIAVSTSFEKRAYSNHWLQTGWNLRSLNGASVYVPNGFEIKPEEGELERMGGNLSLEFRPDANTQFYLRPSFSSTERKEHTVEVLHSVSNSNTSQVQFTGLNAGRFIGNNRTERRDFDTRKEQELMTVVAGFKKVGRLHPRADDRPLDRREYALQQHPHSVTWRHGPITFDTMGSISALGRRPPSTPRTSIARRTRETRRSSTDTLSARWICVGTCTTGRGATVISRRIQVHPA